MDIELFKKNVLPGDLGLLGYDFMSGLIHFKRGNWRTLKGAESYMNRELSAFEDFCYQGAKGKIYANEILQRLFGDRVQEIENSMMPDLF